MPRLPPFDASRRAFLQECVCGVAATALASCTNSSPKDSTATVAAIHNQSSPRMPVLFVGHGSPMNAIEDNAWSRAFRALGKALPRPRAVLAMSAHWCTEGTWLTGSARPATVHDFGGFPQELYEVEYPAPGMPELAKRVQQLLSKQRAQLDSTQGLDHGTWSVLCHTAPAADIPVVQMSLDVRLSATQRMELARALMPLRDEGVLLLGSGNITHNLQDAFARLHRGDTTTPAFARDFDRAVVEALQQRDSDRLAALIQTPEGRRSHPTEDHWWPLLYAAGAAERDEAVTFPIEGFDLGSLSMRTVRMG